MPPRQSPEIQERNEKIRAALIVNEKLPQGMRSTYTAIAKRFGVSKNVVIGLASRLGLSRPERSPIKRGVPNKRKSRAKSREIAESAVKVERETIQQQVERVTAPLKAKRVRGMRFRHCQYIRGETTPFTDEMKCGAETVEGRAYCPEHHRRCTRREGEPA